MAYPFTLGLQTAQGRSHLHNLGSTVGPSIIYDYLVVSTYFGLETIVFYILIFMYGYRILIRIIYIYIYLFIYFYAYICYCLCAWSSGLRERFSKRGEARQS